MTSRADTWLPPVVAILVLVAVAFPALDQYNATWDEALGDYFFGERYLSFFTSFDPVYLDFRENPYPADRSPDLFISPFKGRPHEYYPFANILAVATSQIVSRWLGLVDAFDGYHAVNLWLAALLIWFFFAFLRQRGGLVTAVVGLGLLLSSPRVFSHMMANIKDFPLMVFYTLTLIAFLRAYEAGSVRGILGSGVLWGLALATKANALFLPGILLLLIPIGELPEPWRGRHRRLLAVCAAACGVGVAVMVAVWPFLWKNPAAGYLEHLEYITLRGYSTRPESVAPAFEAVLLTTPTLFLALFALGLVVLVPRLRRRDRMAWLLVLWIAVVMGRYVLPRSVNFDGVRHFLELFPAMAAVAGWGAAWLGQQLARRVAAPPRTLKAAFAALLLVPGAWTLVVTHPFQVCYWNVLAGGFRGAYEDNQPQVGDYWGMSYRLGLEWINENAPPNAYLTVPVVEHAVRLVAQERLRDDIVLLPVTRPTTPEIAPERLAKTRELAREAPVYVMFVERRDWLNELMEDCLRHLEPEVVWELDGAPVLYIYRYTPPSSDVSMID